jgi:hypothetical protein
MESVAVRRWSCRLLGAFLALLATDACAPVARAGCGGHVLVGAPAAGQDTTRPMPAHPAPEPGQAPCSGPHCSRAPATPAHIPVSPSTPAEQQWALVSTPVESPGPAPLWALAEQSPGRPIRGGADVYHPPR